MAKLTEGNEDRIRREARETYRQFIDKINRTTDADIELNDRRASLTQSSAPDKPRHLAP